MKIATALSQGGVSKTLQATMQSCYSEHARKIATGQSKLFHIGKPYLAPDAKGVSHIYTDDLHFYAAAIARHKHSGHAVGAVHFDGSNLHEIEEAIEKLSRFKQDVQVIVSNNEAAPIHLVHDQPFYQQRISNLETLSHLFESAGFEVDSTAGTGRTFGLRAERGTFQEDQPLRGVLAFWP